MSLSDVGWRLEYDNYILWIVELCLVGIVFVLSCFLARELRTCCSACCMCCFCCTDEPESIDNPVYIQPSAPAVGPPLPGVQTSTVNPVIYIERAQTLDFHFNMHLSDSESF